MFKKSSFWLHQSIFLFARKCSRTPVFDCISPVSYLLGNVQELQFLIASVQFRMCEETFKSSSFWLPQSSFLIVRKCSRAPVFDCISPVSYVWGNVQELQFLIASVQFLICEDLFKNSSFLLHQFIFLCVRKCSRAPFFYCMSPVSYLQGNVQELHFLIASVQFRMC